MVKLIQRLFKSDDDKWIIMTIHSVERWESGDLWVNWIKKIEDRFSTRLVAFEPGAHLDPDHKMPVVTKAEDCYDEFEKLGSSSIFYSGTFSDGISEILLSLTYYPKPKWQQNYLRLVFSGDQPDNEKLKSLFRESVGLFRANQGAIDYFWTQKKKKRRRGLRYGIGLELVGMSWLNYFGRAIRERYAEGIEALKGVCEVEETSSGGVEIMLKEKIDAVTFAERLKAEETVGKDLFWDPKGKHMKEYGQFFPTFEEFKKDWSQEK